MFVYALPPHVPDGLIVPKIVAPPFEVTLIRSLAFAINFLLFLFRANQVPLSLLFCFINMYQRLINDDR